MLLTSHFPLPILPAPQDGVRDAHPRVVLAELREQVVGHEAHGAGQDEQHDAEERLQGQRARLGIGPVGQATTSDRADWPSPFSSPRTDKCVLSRALEHVIHVREPLCAGSIGRGALPTEYFFLRRREE